MNQQTVKLFHEEKAWETWIKILDNSLGFETLSGQKIDSPVTDSECCDKLLASEAIRLRFDEEWRSFNLLGTADTVVESLMMDFNKWPFHDSLTFNVMYWGAFLIMAIIKKYEGSLKYSWQGTWVTFHKSLEISIPLTFMVCFAYVKVLNLTQKLRFQGQARNGHFNNVILTQWIHLESNQNVKNSAKCTKSALIENFIASEGYVIGTSRKDHHLD